MMKLGRWRFTYANVVASLGLFLALGGGAYAAGSTGSRPKSQTPIVSHISLPQLAPEGTLLGSAGGLRLEIAYGRALRVRNESAAVGQYACHWLHGIVPDSTGSAIGRPAAGETTAAIVPDGADPPMVRCRLSDGETGAITEVLVGLDANHRYTGYAVSHGAQS